MRVEIIEVGEVVQKIKVGLPHPTGTVFLTTERYFH